MRALPNTHSTTYRLTYAIWHSCGYGNPYWGECNLNVQDTDEHFGLWVLHTTWVAHAPYLRKFVDGGAYTVPTVTKYDANMPSAESYADPIWVRVVCDPDDQNNQHLKVYCATTEAGLGSAAVCMTFNDTGGDLTGGSFGLGGGSHLVADDFKVEVPDGQGGWQTETWEGFEVDANG